LVYSGGVSEATSVRNRLLRATVELMRRRGADGFGVAELLAEAGVARRSLYQYFPGGKEELVAAATADAASYVLKVLDRTVAETGDDPGECIGAWIQWWKSMLVSSDFSLSCPLVMGSLADERYPGAAQAAAAGFTGFQERAAAAYRHAGMAADRAAALASVAVSAIEGAVIVSRSLRSLEPLDRVAEHFSGTVGPLG
jgi:TetR/AcrR family transcriptional repressor of lmrAB and yxaGH operons